MLEPMLTQKLLQHPVIAEVWRQLAMMDPDLTLEAALPLLTARFSGAFDEDPAENSPIEIEHE